MSETHTQVRRSFQKHLNGSGDSGCKTEQMVLHWGSKLDSKCGTEWDAHTQGNAMRHVQQSKWFQGQCHCTPVIHQSHISGCPAAQMQRYENKGETTIMFST